LGLQHQTFAKDYFPDGDAIGRSFTIADPRVPGTWQIVGVVRDAKYGSAREVPQRTIYLPLVQIAGPHAYGPVSGPVDWDKLDGN
jgi:hypothetical protein